jgi:hypothetical protein
MSLPPFVPSISIKGHPAANSANPANPNKTGWLAEANQTAPAAKPANRANSKNGLPPFVPSFAIKSPPPANSAKPANRHNEVQHRDFPNHEQAVRAPVRQHDCSLGRATSDPAEFDGIFPNFDRVAAALLHEESPEEKAHNDRLAEADEWRPPMVPAPFFPEPPNTPTAGQALPFVTKPAVTKPAGDSGLDFVRSALTANIFAAARARGLTFKVSDDGDLILQGRGLTERDRLQFEPYEAAIIEALNP